MTAVNTRKSMQDFRDVIKEDFCIIPSDVIKHWIDDSRKQQELFISTQSKLADAMERIAKVLDTHTATKENFSETLLDKIDTLTQVISSKNLRFTAPPPSSHDVPDGELKISMDKKWDLEEKRRGQNRMSKYTQLLESDKPFQTKVTMNNHVYDRGKQREHMSSTVEVKIHLMEERVKEWARKLNDLETELHLKLNTLHTSKRKTNSMRLEEHSSSESPKLRSKVSIESSREQRRGSADSADVEILHVEEKVKEWAGKLNDLETELHLKLGTLHNSKHKTNSMSSTGTSSSESPIFQSKLSIDSHSSGAGISRDSRRGSADIEVLLVEDRVKGWARKLNNLENELHLKLDTIGTSKKQKVASPEKNMKWNKEWQVEMAKLKDKSYEKAGKDNVSCRRRKISNRYSNKDRFRVRKISGFQQRR